MAAELVTPTDELSGLPYPILPSRAMLPLDNPELADWHHHWHPRLHPGLRTVAGLALRNSRMQLLDRKFHNESETRYHKFFAGPPIPSDEDEIFKIVVLATAGYIPRLALDLSSGEPKQITMNHQQIKMLRVYARPDERLSQISTDPKNRLRYRNVRYGYEPIRDFLTQYVLEQHVDMPQRTIDEYLFTSNVDRQEYLGHLLLVKQAEAAADKVRNVYTQARSSGSLNPHMPIVDHLVKYKLGTARDRKQLFPRLTAQLAFKHGVTGLILRS